MMLTKQLLVSLLLFLITIGFGLRISKQGKPYNPALFNVHKLVALAGVVIAVLWARSSIPLDDLTGWGIPFLFGAGISVVMLFATGGVMSAREEEPGIALLFHRANPVMIILCLVGLYFTM
jgi:hypothetical protein